MKSRGLRLLIALLLAAAPAAAERFAFTVEKNHSSLVFTVPIAGGLTKVTGTFPNFQADIVWDSEDMTKSSVKAVIQVASVNTGNPDRDKDIQGPVFFDATNHPQMTFVSRRIEKRGDRYAMIGDLTMKGVTKPV